MINFGNVSEGVSEYLASPEGVRIVSEQMEALKTGGEVFRKYVDAGQKDYSPMADPETFNVLKESLFALLLSVDNFGAAVSRRNAGM